MSIFNIKTAKNAVFETVGLGDFFYLACVTAPLTIAVVVVIVIWVKKYSFDPYATLVFGALGSADIWVVIVAMEVLKEVIKFIPKR